MSDEFRTEIIENQKARIDLVKWKLVIVAVVFGWSLDKSARESLSFWALSLVPFVCLFVDCQCFHINLRTLVIANFLRRWSEEKANRKYETFVQELRKNAVKRGRGDIFQLEQGVLTYSTVALCVAVFAWPFIAHSFNLDLIGKNPGEIGCWISGVAGLICSIWLFSHYSHLKDKIAPESDLIDLDKLDEEDDRGRRR